VIARLCRIGRWTVELNNQSLDEFRHGSETLTKFRLSLACSLCPKFLRVIAAINVGVATTLLKQITKLHSEILKFNGKAIDTDQQLLKVFWHVLACIVVVRPDTDLYRLRCTDLAAPTT